MIDRLTVNHNTFGNRTNASDNKNIDSLKKPDNFNESVDSSQTDITKVEKEEKIEDVIKGINDFLQPTDTSIKFVLHEKLDDYYVNIVDDTTKEVIKEIPSKKLLDTHAKMMEFVGLMVDEKA
jgi:flagellar protein FlaG